MATTMLFLRHGESEWNALGRWQGQADPPLTELGRRQAQLAATSLGTVDLIFSSDLQRAQTTAQILSGSGNGDAVVTLPAFRERDAGPWSGLTRLEIEEGWPGYLRSGRRPDGYEDEDELLPRVLRGIAEVVTLVEDGTVAVVTHAGVIYTLEGHLGEPFVRVGNLGGRVFTVVDRDLQLGDRLELIDETSVPDLL